MVRIGGYCTNKQIVDIINLLKEYHEIFSRDYKDLKGLVEEMGEMKIKLILGAKIIKNQPYKLAHKYKTIIQK
jgi:hypothetical protein